MVVADRSNCCGPECAVYHTDPKGTSHFHTTYRANMFLTSPGEPNMLLCCIGEIGRFEKDQIHLILLLFRRSRIVLLLSFFRCDGFAFVRSGIRIRRCGIFRLFHRRLLTF